MLIKKKICRKDAFGKRLLRYKSGQPVSLVSLTVLIFCFFNFGCTAMFPESKTGNNVAPHRKLDRSVAQKTKVQKNFLHTIRWRGETLYCISRWYTGTVNNWKIIAKANPGLDPKLLTIGLNINIPEYIIINRNPLPQSFVTKMCSKKKKEKKVKKVKPAKDKKGGNIIQIPIDNELFGPIE